LPTTVASAPIESSSAPAPATSTTEPNDLGRTSPASAEDAFLATAPQPTTQSSAPSAADCHTLGDIGWGVDTCNNYRDAGGAHASFLIESRDSGRSSTAWRVLVMHYSQDKGVWDLDLVYRDDAGDQTAYAREANGSMDVVNGVWTFGFRLQGSTALLAYDVVDLSDLSHPTVVAHRALAHGQANVGYNEITDYQAEYPNREPNCCPAYYLQSTVDHNQGRWTVTTVAHVNHPGPGEF